MYLHLSGTRPASSGTLEARPRETSGSDEATPSQVLIPLALLPGRARARPLTCVDGAGTDAP